MKSIDFDFIADLYDDYVNVDFDLPFYRSICKRYSGNILELMCGTGRVSLPLIKDGINLTCVDYSKEMLEVFSKKLNNHEVLLVCQDVSELNIDKKFEFVFIPFNSFSEITSKEKRKNTVKKIIDHLTDDGDFLITLYNPEYRLKTVDGNMKCLGRYELSNDRTLIVTYYNSFDSNTNLVHGTQFYEIYDNKNKLIEKRFLEIAFTLVPKDEICELCSEFGVFIKEVFGGYNFAEFSDNSQFMNCLITKRGSVL